MHEPHDDTADNPLQGYFDWQITTLMLAYDLADPIAQDEEDKVHARREKVEQEVRDLSLAQIPQEYLENENLDWPPQIMQDLTRVTLTRASAIIAGA